MPITDFLAKNAQLYPDEVCLLELNPELQELSRRVTWKEYELVERAAAPNRHRREITWRAFDETANQFANLLLSRGIGKGDKVAILLMNSLEWLPIYFGILRTGAVAVPMNYRYTADEIKYCLELSESSVLIFGPEFIGRIEAICDSIPRVRIKFFVGDSCPTFAESCERSMIRCLATNPNIPLTDEDDAAIYFSSGTTGFRKRSCISTRALLGRARSSKITTDKIEATASSAFLPFIIPVRKCIGSAVFFPGAKQSSCVVSNHVGLSRQFPKNNVRSSGFWSLGSRYSRRN
jgi:long-chain acyl-CoA synthetase